MTRYRTEVSLNGLRRLRMTDLNERVAALEALDVKRTPGR